MQKQYVTYKSIYIFIYSTSEAYLQFLFTATKGGKEIQTDRETEKTSCKHQSGTTALSSEEKTSRKAYCWEPTSCPRWHPQCGLTQNLFWWLIKSISIFLAALNQCAVPKLSDTNLIWISPLGMMGVDNCGGSCFFFPFFSVLSIDLKKHIYDLNEWLWARRTDVQRCVWRGSRGAVGAGQERYARFELTQKGEHAQEKKEKKKVCCYW